MQFTKPALSLLIFAFLLPQTTQATEVTKYYCLKQLELLRVLEGGHPIYVVKADVPELEQLLPEQLHAFGKNKKSAKNWVKEHVLFNKPLVRTVRWALTGRKDTHEAVNLYEDIPANVRFNYVIHGEANGESAGVVIGQVDIKIKRLDDLLSKHLLLAIFHPNVRYAGEFWKDEEGVIHFSNNSGTYKPDAQYLEQVEKVLRQIFPDPAIRFKGEAVDPEAAKREKAAGEAEAKPSVIRKAVQALKGIDLAFPWQFQLKKEIQNTTSERQTVRVPLSHLLSIHKMVGVNDDKVSRRAEILQKNEADILAAGVLTADTQTQLIPSKTPLSVIQDEQGRYILFDGNGRLKAIQKVFEQYPELEVEVELFVTASPRVQSLVKRIRSWRGFED